MSKYTITIKNLINNDFDFGLKDYPIWNESYRNTLNQKILNHYYENEIGFETASLFKFYLNNKLNEIMPYYNNLYNAEEQALTNILGNIDLYEESNRQNNNDVNTTSNSKSDSKNLFQDTPQGKINFAKLEDQQWATNYTNNVNDIDDNSTSHGENEENYNRHIFGNNGKKYNIELLNDVRTHMFNIDMMIINDLEELFMQIF